ncbi:MAG: hypothetical protein JWQ98_3450 [Chlorobi bacterium]|nr:hypothetical protein [Chlorobiota bacterium]
MLKYILNVVIYLSLAVWIGGLVFFGAGVASLVFQQGILPNHTMAGAVNSAILGRLKDIEIVAGVLLLGGTFYTAFRYRHWLNWAVLLLSLGMLGTAGYYSSILYPKMESLRVAIGDFDNIPAEKMEMKAEFDRGHILYSTLVKGVLGGGVLVLILHTVAFVRYTELHASRYRRLENDWRQLTEKGNPADAAGEPRVAAATPQKSVPEAIPKKPVAAT